jgi:Ca-activated chloride channel family protein
MALVLYNLVFWVLLVLVSLIFLFIAFKRPLRWWPAWILRMVFVGLIISLILSTQTASVKGLVPQRQVMILDYSDSLSENTRLETLSSAREWQKQNSSRMLVVYGEQTYISYPDDVGMPVIDGRANNLEDALNIASNLLGRTTGTILLTSDGLIPQSDSIQSAIQTLIHRGQALDWISLKPGYDDNDVYLQAIWAPRNLWKGLPFYVIVPVFGRVSVEDIGYQIKVNGKNIDLRATFGKGYTEFLIPPQEMGLVTIEVWANVSDDPNPENNAAYLTVQVHNPPNVLFVSEPINSPQVMSLLEDIRSSSIPVDVILPNELSTSLDVLDDYQVIFLNDFLASQLTEEQMIALKVFVSRLGRGLIFLGGRNSYTLGGYKNSLLEPMLPVKLEPPERNERPSNVFVLVLDRSASMRVSPPEGNTPIDMARESAMRALEKLQLNDYLGVLTFNADFNWDVPLRKVESGVLLREALDAVSRVAADDGTKMYQALNEAVLQMTNLPEDAPPSRNVLLLSDGESEDGDLNIFIQLAITAQSSGINVSTIAFGEANEEIMQAIAQNGNGRYYHVLKTDDLPQVMIQESEAIRGENIQRGTTNLLMSKDDPDHPILFGLRLDLLPNINSYNALTSKSDEGAEDVLVSANFGDPILSVWQYGLGRVVAWMSDAGQDWTSSWNSGNTRGIFWSQVVRYALPRPDSSPVNIDISVGDVNLSIDATIMDDSNPDVLRFLDQIEVKFSYIEMNSDVVHSYTLYQVAPGQYHLTIPKPVKGAYRAMLEYESLNGENIQIPAPFEVNTTQEWLPSTEVEESIVDMKQLVSATSGEKITMDALASPIETGFEVSSTEATSFDQRWYILMAVIIYWPLEIFIRRRWLPWQ